jgi:hypothetical protein
VQVAIISVLPNKTQQKIRGLHNHNQSPRFPNTVETTNIYDSIAKSHKHIGLELNRLHFSSLH